MVNARCKCGQLTLQFKKLKLEDVDGKWEGECCKQAAAKEALKPEAPKAEPAPKKSKKKAQEEPKEEPKE